METNPSQQSPQEDVVFENYHPPSWGAIALPNHVIYVLLAVAVVFLALCAITRHLIADLTHDLADWRFGVSPPEVMLAPWVNKDKFWADWIPQALPGLEELASVEQTRVGAEDHDDEVPIWVITHPTEACLAGTKPSVTSGKNI